MRAKRHLWPRRSDKNEETSSTEAVVAARFFFVRVFSMLVWERIYEMHHPLVFMVDFL